MKNIHEQATLQEILTRIDTLSPATQRQWGKMNVSQMLAHCANALEVNLGDKVYKRGLAGRLFGRLAKRSIVGPKPFKQGLPTDPNFVIANSREFDMEKQRLVSLIKRLSASDPQLLAANAHPFFGPMTAGEWNILNYKHLDHHLRQFGA